jgi:oligopeptide transport system substrate-binding protein
LKYKIVLIALVCIFAAGCGESDGSGFVFKYDIAANPRTLDPQTANCHASALLIANLFDGLLQVESDGRITANVCTEYFVSDDGLTYTFLLRDDVYWYFNGDDSVRCTAYDFVFAFRRLFNPAIKSENAQFFYNIKNSRGVHSGAIPYLDAIGVEAMGDFELVITLSEPNPLFPYLLTTSPAMPCNEELFERTAGRYGLNASSVPSNGAFYITHWNFDPFSSSSDNNLIIMRRNERNSESRTVYPRGLNFFINYEDPHEHFTEGTTHALIAEGEAADSLIAQDFPYSGYENSVWGITFNRRGVFRSEDLRTALAAGFDRSAVHVGDTGFREAREIIPPLINLGNMPYRIATGTVQYIEYNAEAARDAYERGADAAGRGLLTGLRVIVPADEDSVIFLYLSRILHEWQKNLGFFCRIETLSADEFNAALLNRDYDIAMMRLKAEFNSPDAFLNSFGDFTEQELLEQVIFIPVCFQTEMIFYAERAEDLIYNPFTGAVIFKDGKWFK